MEKSIESRIVVVRGQRVILDSDLAKLYGVSTTRLNQQVTRNLERFPEDFMFEVSFQEVMPLMLQNATSKRGGRRKPPRVFTEVGAVMAANVLNSRIAISASILLVRVFVRLREAMHEHADLKRRLQLLEQRVARESSEHAEELKEIRFAIAQLEQQPEVKKRKIGF